MSPDYKAVDAIASKADVANHVRLRDQVMERLKAAPPPPGQRPPLLVYLGVLLQRGRLNAGESAELARLVIGQGKKELLTNWCGASLRCCYY